MSARACQRGGSNLPRVSPLSVTGGKPTLSEVHRSSGSDYSKEGTLWNGARLCPAVNLDSPKAIELGRVALPLGEVSAALWITFGPMRTLTGVKASHTTRDMY